MSLPGRPPARARHILVLEDDDSTARALRRLLTLHGYVVHVAGTLAEASEIARVQRLDLLLCDLQLPDGSGLDVPDRLRQERWERSDGAPPPNPPAIVLSALGRPEDVARSRARRFAAHLVKPVDEHLLVSTIRRVLAAAIAASGDAAIEAADSAGADRAAESA
jgi:CheY-like chemotaxis protein